ncbi:hypothetical protein R1flu_011660 [Riccia fluitans]|uniref:Uncharacterized protein n=1 Tax=Riccia fluitans TaxID=41844 RepID=A0ABD1Z9I8_9MARC
MDSMEGGALVEDNRPSGVGERQGSQSRMRGATHTLLPFPGVVQPLECPSFIGLGVSEPRNDLSIKMWEQYDLFRGKKGNVEGVWSKCKWCNNIYGTNITRLTQQFTYDFSLKNRSMLELPAYKKEGFNKHIQRCSSVPKKVKLHIRELDARQRGKAVLLATQEEASRASREPVNEEEAMAQAWWEGAREPGEPIGMEQDRTKGTNSTRVVRDSPSSIATTTTPLEDGLATSQSKQFRSVPKRTMQQPLRPMMDAQ